ncbi:hypothetical protein P7K49_035831 [Saguinus oedipus]|uniref:Uncharacterized protein n=1 Tax=Saguinus oedipus TaxID=9490 RepID=A0ABQ9TP33_SAGOE|nr:hypothetical protein P7K49_035831 [Saguinus oedipus]
MPLSLLLRAHSTSSPPPSFACQSQPLSVAPPARYPAAPLPRLLGRDPGPRRPRILPPRPASCASHLLVRDPARGRAPVGGSGQPRHLRRDGCLSGATVPRGLSARHCSSARLRSRLAGAGNCGTPRETPRHGYALTHGGGARGRSLALEAGGEGRGARGLKWGLAEEG